MSDNTKYTISSLTFPKYVAELQIGSLVICMVKVPNRFHRFMLSLVFGMKWKMLE